VAGGLRPEVALARRISKDAIAQGDKFAKAQTAMEGFLAAHPTDLMCAANLGALYIQTGLLAQVLSY